MRPGWRRVYWVTAQNDDASADRLRITGPGSNQQWAVRYDRNGTDITDQVTGHGYRTPSLATGEQELIKVTIKARSSARIGSVKTVRVLLTSLGNRVFKDAVRAKVTVRRG